MKNILTLVAITATLALGACASKPADKCCAAKGGKEVTKTDSCCKAKGAKGAKHDMAKM